MFHAPTHGKMRPVYPPKRPDNAIYGIFSMERMLLRLAGYKYVG